MKLIKFLEYCKKLVDENPNALQMEVFAEKGSSGALDNLSYPYIDKISRWDNSEMDIKEMLPRDYPLDSVIRVYIGY